MMYSEQKTDRDSLEPNRKCIQQRESVSHTVTLQPPVGQATWECEVIPVLSDGAVEQLVVEFQDITERIGASKN